MPRFLGSLVVAPLLAACGGPGTSSITVDQACLDNAKAQCAKLDECRQNGVANAYGAMGACVSRMHDNCVTSHMAPGTGNTADATEACATALPGESCQDFLQGNPVAACAQKTGSLGDGTACAYNAQCTSGFCAVPKGSLCGACAPVPAAGDPCDTVASCGPDKTCTPMQTCQPWVAAGGACDGKTEVCAPGSSCVIPAMATMGTCHADAASLAATCDFKRQTGPACDANAGLYCANTNACIAVSYVAAGSACGAMKGTADDVCTNGSSCFAGTCLALAAEGGACDLAAGPGCMNPGRCVVSGGGTAGTCALPDPSQCM